jgi:hypothetical protein
VQKRNSNRAVFDEALLREGTVFLGSAAGNVRQQPV